MNINDIAASVVCGALGCVMLIAVVIPLLIAGRRRRRYERW